MTTTPEKFNALRNAQELLLELCDPTYRPTWKEFRQRARACLKHYPWPGDIDRLERLANIEGDGWRGYADRMEEEASAMQREGDGL